MNWFQLPSELVNAVLPNLKELIIPTPPKKIENKPLIFLHIE